MKLTFYLKLALTNLKKNRETYFPYFLACVGTIFMYFLFESFVYNEGLRNLNGKEMVYVIFMIGESVVTVFAAIFIFYANSFLMKRRKKEIGLYSILGLEKRQISAVMFFESLIMAVISLVMGLVLGVVFGKLSFLVLMRLIDASPDSSFILSPTGFLKTAILYSVIFLLTFFFNDIHVRKSKPIALLKSSNEGEKEPRGSILITLIGAATLGYGYYIAITEESILMAMLKFWVAVIMVIIGTQCLFTSGSIFTLKALRKNKRFYYNPNNFISVSNLIYRMKKNAAGLANICILSTMILVTVSTTFALYIGKQDMLKARNPRQFAISCSADEVPLDRLAVQLEDAAVSHQITLKNVQAFPYISMTLYRPDGGPTFETAPEDAIYYSNTELYLYEFTILLLEDYNRLEGINETLDSNEVIYFSRVGNYGYDTVTLPFASLTVKKEVDSMSFTSPKADVSMNRGAVMIVKDQAVLDGLVEGYQALLDHRSLNLASKIQLQTDLEGTEESKIEFVQAFRKAVREEYGTKNGSISFLSYDLDNIEWNAMYGGFLFLGVSLGMLFMMAMVLIIYFKQVSEGYEDRNRFEVLQKVGMDRRDIKKTINRQLRLVFFLPLIGAMIHLAFAFKILRNLLAMFQLENSRLILLCFAGVSLAFALIYIIVYQLTSRVYYKIVNR